MAWTLKRGNASASRYFDLFNLAVKQDVRLANRTHRAPYLRDDMANAVQVGVQLDYAPEPDVYETAAVNSSDETSSPKNDSTAASSIDSASESEAEDEDGPFGAISRRRLFPERARSRFQALGRKVDTKGLDLSDRVDGRRKGLRVRSNNMRDDENESLDARIARLRREVEECRLQAQNGEAVGNAAASSTVEGVQELGRALGQLESNMNKVDAQPVRSQVPQQQNGVVEEQYDDQVLGKIAAFDTRLASLERALGIASLDMAPDGSFSSPVLPTIELLDQQVSALLTSASIVQLDAANSRVRKLTQDAEQLARLRSAPISQDTQDDNEGENASVALTQEDISKLNALYGLLPTLQSLSPTVPALLQRLRSLSALHAGAATAASELDEVEKRQSDTDAELKAWTEGLKRVEAAVANASEANGKNGMTVQGWVKDLEARIESLR